MSSSTASSSSATLWITPLAQRDVGTAEVLLRDLLARRLFDDRRARR